MRQLTNKDERTAKKQKVTEFHEVEFNKTNIKEDTSEWILALMPCKSFPLSNQRNAHLSACSLKVL
jgi:hypothetical protein